MERGQVWSAFHSAVEGVWSLLERPLRTRLWLVLAGRFLAVLLELAAVLLLSRFMAYVVAPQSELFLGPLPALAAWLGVDAGQPFTLFFAIVTICSLALSNLCSLMALRLATRYLAETDVSLSSRLLERYLRADYLTVSRRHGGEVLGHIHSGVAVKGVLAPFLQGLSYGVVTALYIAAMLWADPVIAIALSLFVASSYALMSWQARRALQRLGDQTLEHSKRAFKVSSEALQGLKALKISGREEHFLQRYRSSSEVVHLRKAEQQVLESLPRFYLEVVAFASILGIAVYYLGQGTPPEQLMSILSLYTFAGYRLIPSVHELYLAWNRVGFHAPLMAEILEICELPNADQGSGRPSLEPQQEIRFRDVFFTYREPDAPVLCSINATIEAGQKVGIVGPTGSGKSTLVDLLMGLLSPTEGSIEVDGAPLGSADRRAWQQGIGYVPQEIFLADDTVAANIAFGIEPPEVDMGLVEEAARAAELHSFVTELPEGYETQVGERGVRLSGGQRQRLGLARALYRRPHLLVLDEATSALDSLTERFVVKAISELSSVRTVVTIAHRLSTVKDCDRIWVLDRGRLVAVGTFDELLRAEGLFKRMVDSAQFG